MVRLDRKEEALFLAKRYGGAMVDDYQENPLAWRLEWKKGDRKPVLWVSPTLFFDYIEPRLKEWVEELNGRPS